MASSARNNKTKPTAKVKKKVEGEKVDQFIRETKKFLSKPNPPVNDGSVSDSESDSIIITDDDIESFLEVVTGSGLNNPALSSTRRSLDNCDDLNVTLQNNNGSSSQAPVQSTSDQACPSDGWGTGDMGTNLSNIASSDVSDFNCEDAIDDKLRILTPTKAFSQEILAENGFKQVFNRDNMNPVSDDGFRDIGSQPPLQAASNSVFMNPSFLILVVF